MAIYPLLGSLTVGLAVGFLTAGLYQALTESRERAHLRDRLRWAMDQGSPPGPGPLTALAAAFDASPAGRRLRDTLTRSGLELRPAGLLLVLAACFLLTWILSHRVLQLGSPLDLLLSVLIVWVGLLAVLRAQRERAAERLRSQLSELARQLGAAIRAGLTVSQAIERVAQVLPAPAGTLLRRADSELKLGLPLSGALDNLLHRADSPELRILVTTVLLQHQLGGDLALSLEAMARTLAQRQVLAREVAAMTAEARTVAGILPMMPLLAAVLLNLFLPGLLNVLFTPAGLILLVASAAIQALSLVIIRNLAAIRV